MYRSESRSIGTNSALARTVFNNNFSVLDTVFYRKLLELTKNHYQKLITPKGLNMN